MAHHATSRFQQCAILAALGLPLLAFAGQSDPSASTRNNAPGGAGAAPTADQAKNDRPDRENMKRIRRAIVRNKSLSTAAHNVKVISQNGKVTLKGPVRSEEERTTIATEAANVVGAANVDNQLTVENDSASGR